MPRWQNLKNPHEEKFIRGYSVYIGGGCGEFPGYYGQIEGFGSKYKRDIKRYYPTGDRRADPGTFSSFTGTTMWTSIRRRMTSLESPNFDFIFSGDKTSS